MVRVATVARLSAEQQPHLQGPLVTAQIPPMQAAAVGREVLKMALLVRLALPAVAAAMEHRSLLGSLASPLTWGPIPSAAAAAAAAILLAALAALVAAGKVRKAGQAEQARMVLAVVAVVAPTGPPGLAEPVEPAAWRFNMPTTAMWPPEI
jgi:hypothetical protein